MSRAFLVYGPESSGTRLATRVLIAGGCQGSADHRQPFDADRFPESGPFVWRRSIPHHISLPDLRQWAGRLPETVEPRLVLCVRDPSAVAASQRSKRSYEATPEETEASVENAFAWMLRDAVASGLRLDFAVYESLVLHPDAAQRALWRRLGLPGGEPVATRDENAKHWEAA